MFVIKDKQVNYILEQSSKGLLQRIAKTPNANDIVIDNVNADSFFALEDICVQIVVWFNIYTQLKHCNDQL